MVDFNKLKERIAHNTSCRKLAQLIVSNLCEDYPELTATPVIWEELINLATEKRGPIKDDDAWTYEQAMKWAKETNIPFGKYSDRPIIDVKPDYVVFLTESEFMQQLKKYVASPYFASIR